MQQTDKYQLNLIEMSDTFSPAALNENMEKVEAALDAAAAGTAAEAQARAEAVADLDERLQVFESHKIVQGIYTANDGKAQTITVGFTPRLVFIQGINYSVSSLMLVAGTEVGNFARIVENGFYIPNNTGYVINLNNWQYAYIAFA